MSHDGQLDRRQALLGALSLAGATAAFAGCRSGTSALRTPAEDTRMRRDTGANRLVICELYGGNDGLTTLVPFEDDAFYKNRPTTAIAKQQVLRLDAARGVDRGLHPSLGRLRERFNKGELAIVEGCGYPDPVYSHFKSFEIYHTARPEGMASGDGWIGRVRAGPWAADPRAELVIHVGEHLPYSLQSASKPVIAFDTPENFVWLGSGSELEAYGEAGRLPASGTGKAALVASMRETLHVAQTQSPRILEATGRYKPRCDYPDDKFGRSLRSVSALMHSDFDTRVYSVALGNFDTHAGDQNEEHARLLGLLDAGLGAFLKDLEGTPEGERTLVLVYSEFGRRVAENFSHGTDHGAAGPMFLLGPGVRGGLHGAHPSVSNLDKDGNLVMTTDFRRVYASVLRDWLGVDPDAILPVGFAPLDVIAT